MSDIYWEEGIIVTTQSSQNKNNTADFVDFVEAALIFVFYNNNGCIT